MSTVKTIAAVLLVLVAAVLTQQCRFNGDPGEPVRIDR